MPKIAKKTDSKMTTAKTGQTNIEREVDFLHEVGTLRYISRTWKQFFAPATENLAEHILRVTWTALTIAKHEGVTNTDKIIKMALVHDLSESRSVDVHYVSRLYAERFEAAAIRDTLAGTALAAEFIELWEECEKRDTIEAKIIKDADNLEVDLELQELAAMGYTIKNALKEVRQQVGETKLYTETAKKMWQAIQKSDPHHWHVTAKNRLTSGDWKK